MLLYLSGKLVLSSIWGIVTSAGELHVLLSGSSKCSEPKQCPLLSEGSSGADVLQAFTACSETSVIFSDCAIWKFWNLIFTYSHFSYYKNYGRADKLKLLHVCPVLLECWGCNVWLQGPGLLIAGKAEHSRTFLSQLWFWNSFTPNRPCWVTCLRTFDLCHCACSSVLIYKFSLFLSLLLELTNSTCCSCPRLCFKHLNHRTSKVRALYWQRNFLEPHRRNIRVKGSLGTILTILIMWPAFTWSARSPLASSIFWMKKASKQQTSAKTCGREEGRTVKEQKYIVGSKGLFMTLIYTGVCF